MRKKIQITKKSFVWTAAIGGLIIMLIVIAGMVWSSKQTVSDTNEAVSEVSSFYLEAMADRRAKTITNLINSNFDQMEKALIFMEEENISSKEDLRVAIGKVKSLLSLNRFALVDEDDIVYTQYTTYTGGSRHSFLSEGKTNERSISTVFLYGSSKQLCLAVPTPDLKIMGKQFKSCFVQIDIREIVDLLAFDDEGRTYFGLYSKGGENLSDTELGPYISDKNIFDTLRGIVSDNVLNEGKENFANGAEGSISFVANGAEETLCYVPVEGTDWEMVVLIRESVIHDRIRDISEKSLAISRNLIIFTLAVVVLFAAALLFQYRILTGKKLEAEKENSRTFRKMANTDSMTGIRNKHAYSEYETALNQKLQNGEIQKLGVVVCDINGLKYVNDTQGHAAGDKLIKDACSLICEYFNHGAVFRIGGDEFVVILQGKGYDTMQEVLEALNRKVEENITGNAVVVAVGNAELTPQDTQVRDVFERADQVMYRRKGELKEMGAKTRS